MEPVTPPIDLDRTTARRFLVARHLLAPPRSMPASAGSVMTVMARLGSLQFDPLDVTGRNHDLVLAARLDGYRRSIADGLLYSDRLLYETYNKGLSIVPTAELPYYRITWDRNRDEHGATTFAEHASLVAELLDRIREDGPLSSTDVEPRPAIDWYWRPTNMVRAVLEALAEAGILGLARREGNRRVYDLVERLFPSDLLAQRPPKPDQWRHKLLSRYRAHGLLGRTGSAELWIGTSPSRREATDRAYLPTRKDLLNELVARGELVLVAVDGVRGDRFVLADEVPLLEAARAPGPHETAIASGVAFLAPLDPFVWDRDLLRSLFDFDYVWEVYVPARKRRWGYYVLPLLYGDRLVGGIEPRFDRRAGTLRVIDIWWQDEFEPFEDPQFIDALADVLTAHATFGGVGRVVLPRTARHRPLAQALRERLVSRGRPAPVGG